MKSDKTYRLFGPVIGEKQKVAVYDEEDVHESEQMMRVPERIEPGQAKERPRQLDDASPKRVQGQSEGKGH